MVGCVQCVDHQERERGKNLCASFCLVRSFGVGWSFGGGGGLPEEVLLLLEESSIDERMKVGHAAATARGDRRGPVQTGQRVDPVVENGKRRETANLEGIHHAASTTAHLTTRRREPAAIHKPGDHWSKGFRDLKNRKKGIRTPNKIETEVETGIP